MIFTMIILGSICWLRIKLEVSVVGCDGVLSIAPWVHLAFSKYNNRLYGYKIVISSRRRDVLLNIYECAPLSRASSWFVPEYLAVDESAGKVLYAKLAKKYYQDSNDFLQNEFELEFYKWPFWACGAKFNIYNVSLPNLECIVSGCVRRVNRANSLACNPITGGTMNSFH